MSKDVSKCCGAEAHFRRAWDEEEGGYTYYLVCDKCKRACEVEQMNEHRKLLELILNDDWHDLLMYLTMEEIKKNRIATSSEDYKWEGDYETDARHTFPNRNKLIKTVIKKVLSEVEPKEVEDAR